MSDIKRIALIFLIVTFFFNSFSNFAYAADDYDHDALMQYEGYGKAMYDSVVEQTTFLTGSYTDNKDYVSQSMNQVKEYADFWYNEYNDFTSSCYQSSAMSCLGEMVERGGAYVLTVGGWIKNLFTDYESTLPPVPDIDYSFFENAMVWDSPQEAEMREGWTAVVTAPDGQKHNVASGRGFGTTIIYSTTYNDSYYYYQLKVGNSYIWKGETKRVTQEEVRVELERWRANIGTVSGVVSELYRVGGSVSVLYQGTEQPFNPVNQTRPMTVINNYLRDNQPQELVVPKLKPSLVCPDGTRVKMNVSGSTFLSVDGTVMMVNKDGTAQVNGEICNLNWQKPTVEYNPNGQPVVTQPDGTKTNLDTGDTTSKPPSSTDLEGCDGVLCGIGKLLDGLGGIVGAITGMVKSLLDGILGLFVPDDLGFISEEFSRITDSLTDKIAITEDLKDMLTGMFTDDATNPLQDITIDLPIVGKPLQFGDMSLINEGVPMLKKVISAIAILYTLIYVYRKITGKGGVMEK